MQGENIHVNYYMPVYHSKTYNSMVQFASRQSLYFKAFHLSLISLSAGDRYHRTLFVNKGKLRQGTGGSTMGEWTEQEEKSDHGKAHPRFCFLEKSSSPSVCKQCSVWGNSEVRKKDAQKQYLLLSLLLLYEE